MVILTALYIFNIIMLVALMVYLRISLAEMKYGYYWSIIRAIFYRDYRGVRWIAQNPIKLVDTILIILLFFLSMTLVGSLIDNDILSRPILSLLLSPMAWGMVLLYMYLTNHKIRILQTNK